MARRVKIRHLFAALTLSLALPIVAHGAQAARAQDADDTFRLDTSRAPDRTFAIAGAGELDFAAAAPPDFFWDERAEAVGDFDESGLFTDFRQVRLGTDPANRDRGEIRIYAARIVPHTVGLAADYGRFLAATWGDLDLGVKATTPTFGEVMTGHETGEGRQLTRLSVWRQNESLLIVRTDASQEDWSFIGPKVAAFVGSLRFQQAMPQDPIFASFRNAEFEIPLAAGRLGTIAYALPPAWRTLPITSEDPTKGVLRFFVDDADASKGSGAMLYSFDFRGEPVRFDETKGTEFAEVVSNVMLDNLLPGRKWEIEFNSSGRFADLKPITDFNAFYTFDARFTHIVQSGALKILVTTRGTQVAGFASISHYPTDMVYRAATLHTTLVDRQLREAVKAYWATVAEPAN